MSVARNVGGEDIGGTSSIRKVGFAAFLGAMIEWYDYFLYGLAAAVVFNQLFFPTQTPLAGTLAAFATFGVGFFFRPVGGMIFGHYGDKLGRKTILVLTLLIMGVATFADRRAADARPGRDLGPDTAGHPARGAGARGRRGVGRRRAHGGRACAAEEARFLRELDRRWARRRATCSRPASSPRWRPCPRSSSSPGAGACRFCSR